MLDSMVYPEVVTDPTVFKAWLVFPEIPADCWPKLSVWEAWVVTGNPLTVVSTPWADPVAWVVAV